MITVEAVLDALRQVIDPELGYNVVDLDMIRDVQVANGTVSFVLVLTVADCPFAQELADKARAAIAALDGVNNVQVRTMEMTPEERGALAEKLKAMSGAAGPTQAQLLNNIGRIVAVMSGKGGVGKSSVAALLAVALRRAGRLVGILDADITGPSIPKLFGVKGVLSAVPLGVLPAKSRTDIQIVSMNLLLPREDEVVIWRGPLIAKALDELWRQVFWGDLEYLLVDLPPGTSDAALTVMQTLPLDGVVMVTTPQELSTMIVRKAVHMTEKLNVSVLGVVENMSYFVCPNCGQKYELFGPSRGAEMAEAAHAPLLGQLPVDPEISRLGDAGQIEEYQSEAYEQLAQAFAVAVPVRSPEAARAMWTNL